MTMEDGEEDKEEIEVLAELAEIMGPEMSTTGVKSGNVLLKKIISD